MKALQHARKGFTLIELLIVIAVIAVLAAIAIPNLLAAREAANETSAIGSLRTMDSGEATYHSRHGNYGTMAQMNTDNLIDGVLSAATVSTAAKSGYYFTLTVGTASQSYFVVAQPLTNSGTRLFYTDESGVIFGNPTITTTAPTADAGGSLSTLSASGWTAIGNENSGGLGNVYVMQKRGTRTIERPAFFESPRLSGRERQQGYPPPTGHTPQHEYGKETSTRRKLLPIQGARGEVRFTQIASWNDRRRYLVCSIQNYYLYKP